MPYFNWQGITLHGHIKRGTLRAATVEDLDAVLFKRDIALLVCKPAHAPFFKQAVKNDDTINFLKQLAMLLEAGVLLPEALTTLSENIHHYAFKEVVNEIAQCVNKGQSFSYALAKHPTLFDPLIIQVIQSGQEGRSLVSALNALVEHLEMVQNFRKQVRSAALMPFITFMFFISIATIIIVGIIPQFATLFATFGNELPPFTQGLIAVSNYVRSWYTAYLLFTCGFFTLVIKNYFSSAYGRTIADGLYLRLPFVGSFITQVALLSYMQSLRLMLKGSMPLPQALQRAQQSIPNVVIRHHMMYLVHEVQAGSSLSTAMMQHPEQLFDTEILAIIHVGQEAGQLSEMLIYVSGLYQNRIRQSLTTVATLLQPLLMLIMGLLITALIFAVYLPILQFSHIVQH